MIIKTLRPTTIQTPILSIEDPLAVAIATPKAMPRAMLFSFLDHFFLLISRR